MTRHKLLLLAAVAALPVLVGRAEAKEFPLFPFESTTEQARGRAVETDRARGLPRDYAGAEAALSAAAEAGDARAMNELGIMALRSRGDDASFSSARGWFSKAAEAGSASARYNLGLSLEARASGWFGWFFLFDRTDAATEYGIAASQGHALAQRRLAVLLENGRGVAANPAEAARLRDLAYARGDRAELDRAAALDGTEDREEVAVQLVDDRCMGCGGVGKHRQPANLPDLRKLADAGDAPARYNLGVILLTGKDATRDPAEAARLFRLAAGTGYAPAARQLGQMHLRGEVVTRSKILGHAWLNLASRDDGKEGRAARDEMRALEAGMSRSEIAEAQRIAAGFAVGE